MKMFMWVFLTSAGLTGFNTYLNLTGYYVDDRTMVSYIDYTTLANIYGFKNLTTDPDAADWVEDGRELKYYYYFFDFSYSGAIIFAIFLFKVYVSVLKKAIRQKSSYAKLYAIEVSGFPRKGDMKKIPKESDLAKHF